MTLLVLSRLTGLSLAFLPRGSPVDLGLPQLGLVLVIGQLGGVHGTVGMRLVGLRRVQQLLLGEASSFLPIL